VHTVCSPSSCEKEKHTSFISQNIINRLKSNHPRTETSATNSENMGAPQKKQRLAESEKIASRKATLRSLLNKHEGSTKHPDVLEAVMELSKLNPTSEPAFCSSKLVGDWSTLSAPIFPNRIKDYQHKKNHEDMKHLHKYTLGRLSFGVFEPKDLVCSIVNMRSPVEQLSSSSLLDQSIHNPVKEPTYSPQNTYMTYPVIIDLIIHTPNGDDLLAFMHNEGYCFPQSDTRLGVKFTGGSLSPHKSVLADPIKLELWKKTFAHAYTKAQAQKGLATKLGESLIYWMLKMTTPSDEDTELRGDHSFRYDMQRSPKGYLDVMYLDDELRITMGNKGSIVITERATANTSNSTTLATKTENDLTSTIKIENDDEAEYRAVVA